MKGFPVFQPLPGYLTMLHLWSLPCLCDTPGLWSVRTPLALQTGRVRDNRPPFSVLDARRKHPPPPPSDHPSVLDALRKHFSVPMSRCRHSYDGVKTHFLVHGEVPAHCVLMSQKESGGSLISLLFLFNFICVFFLRQGLPI